MFETNISEATMIKLTYNMTKLIGYNDVNVQMYNYNFSIYSPFL